MPGKSCALTEITARNGARKHDEVAESCARTVPEVSLAGIDGILLTQYAKGTVDRLGLNTESWNSVPAGVGR